MSNDSINITLYFESTGTDATAVTGGSSGQTNQMLPATSVGSDGGSHTAIAGTLAIPFMTALIGPANLMELAIALPAVGGNWYGGTNIALTLPAVQASLSGTILNSVRIAGTLPSLTASLNVLCGALMDVGITLPSLTATWDTGRSFGGLLLPSLQAQVEIVTAEIMEIAGRLPRLKAALQIGPPTGVLSIALILPAAVGAAGVGGVTALLPAVRGSLLVTAGSVAERITWVMNIENAAMTEFDNFEFKQYARAFNRYWATGMSGNLYQLGGDLDLTAPIGWSFETGISDLGTRGLKGVLAAYLDGIFERHIEFTVVADRGRYTYNHTVSSKTNQENHQTQRVSLGRGIRTGNVGFGVASKKGAYFEMDCITPDYVVSGRNLG